MTQHDKPGLVARGNLVLTQVKEAVERIHLAMWPARPGDFYTIVLLTRDAHDALLAAARDRNLMCSQNPKTGELITIDGLGASFIVTESAEGVEAFIKPKDLD